MWKFKVTGWALAPLAAARGLLLGALFLPERPAFSVAVWQGQLLNFRGKAKMVRVFSIEFSNAKPTGDGFVFGKIGEVYLVVKLVGPRTPVVHLSSLSGNRVTSEVAGLLWSVRDGCIAFRILASGSYSMVAISAQHLSALGLVRARLTPAEFESIRLRWVALAGDECELVLSREGAEGRSVIAKTPATGLSEWC